MIKRISQESLLLWIGLAVFFLNDFLFLINPSTVVFYLSDYLLKGILFISIIIVIKRNNEDFGYLKISKEAIPSVIFWTIMLVVSGIIIDQLVWRTLYNVLPKTNWQLSFPTLSNPFHKIFDLTVGIFLVAFTEELLFRYLIVKKLRKTFSVVIAAIISLFLFALAHWSFGLTALISTMLWAVLPLISVLRLKSLVPAIIAHYLTDVISFSGVVDQLLGGL